MKKKILEIFKILVSLLLMCVFLYYAFRGVDFQVLWGYIKNINPLWILFLIGSNIFIFLLRTYKWYYIVKSVNKDVKFRVLFSNTMINTALNSVLPRGGDILSPILLKKNTGYSLLNIYGTMLIDRLIDITTLIFSGILFIIFYQDKFKLLLPKLNPSLIMLISVIIIMSILIFLLLFFFTTIVENQIKNLLSIFSDNLSTNVFNKIKVTKQSFKNVISLKKLLYLFFLSVLLSFSTNFFFHLFMIPFQLIADYNINFFDSFFSIVILGFGNLVLPTPGAIGISHISIKIILVNFFGVNAEKALSFYSVFHIVSYVFTIIVGALSAFYLNKKLNLKGK